MTLHADTDAREAGPLRDPRSILIRADTGGPHGTGHVMRMIALAESCVARGCGVYLCSLGLPRQLEDRLQQSGIQSIALPPVGGGSVEDSEATIRTAGRMHCEWVVLDGYHFDVGYQKTIRSAGYRLLVVDDDEYSAEWDADVLLNHNLFADEIRYLQKDGIPVTLLGHRYALLRREFVTTARTDRVAHEGKTVLVTMGGVDPDNVAAKVLLALDRADTGSLRVIVVVGAGYEHMEQLEALRRQSRHDVRIERSVPDMTRLYVRSDFVISAGGGTCFEWLYFGLPAAVVAVADNQRPVVGALAKRALALYLGWHADLDLDSMGRKLATWLAAAERDQAPAVVDGWGGARAAAVIDDPCIWIRPADEGDAELYFEWVNSPAVRANSFNSAEVEWAQHLRWFQDRIRNRDSVLFVALTPRDDPVAQVRFDRCDDGVWEVDFSVDEHWRRQGIGKKLVDLGIRQLISQRSDVARIRALVKADNIPSASVFHRLGFTESRPLATDGDSHLVFLLSARSESDDTE